jgi:phenolic acid decarboxylase
MQLPVGTVHTVQRGASKMHVSINLVDGQKVYKEVYFSIWIFDRRNKISPLENDFILHIKVMIEHQEECTLKS